MQDEAELRSVCRKAAFDIIDNRQIKAVCSVTENLYIKRKFRVGRFGIFLYIKGKNNYNKKMLCPFKTLQKYLFNGQNNRNERAKQMNDHREMIWERKNKT
mgnify:CR=1 FL=1